MNNFKRPEQSGNWTTSALRVLKERYLLPDESPEDMCWRVALAIAEAERNWGADDEQIYEIAPKFYGLMVEGLFLPNSPTLMNAGTDNRHQYSACYVLPVDEASAFNTLKRAAEIHRSGGGTGFSFSCFRPKGGEGRERSAGPVLYMHAFDAETEVIKQEGVQRGANMGILRVDHPDILEFIECKLDGGLNNFNISVAITQKFMEAYENNQEYDLVDPMSAEPIDKNLRAEEVFAKIVDAAWKSGDPGLIFIDRINAGPANPTPELGAIEATNPCGEQPLFPNESCNLGSINLAKFYLHNSSTSVHDHIDWIKLENVVRLAVRFLDNVIEVNPYPFADIAEMVHRNRRIGLGVMGWADLLFKLGIPYNSESAIELATEIMGFINETGHQESARLAEDRGAFPNWTQSIYKDDPPLRNATITTIAPTGSLSIIAGCSSGIEPVFALAFSHVVGERGLSFVNPVFERTALDLGFHSEDLMEEVVRRGSVARLMRVPKEIRRIFVTAHQIEPEWHIKMQASFQRHTDNAVSKTINLPHSATRSDVASAYLLAYELGCLGITVYRDRSKTMQVLYKGSGDIPYEDEGSVEADRVIISIKDTPSVIRGRKRYKDIEPDEVSLINRPDKLGAIVYRKATPLGTAFVTVSETRDDQPFEVFITVGKAGSERSAAAEAMGRLMSFVLRLRTLGSRKDRLKEMADQLKGIGGGRPLGFGSGRVHSLPDAISQVLEEHLGEKKASMGPYQPPLFGFGDMCPKCGQATLISEEGCRKCISCSYSDC